MNEMYASEFWDKIDQLISSSEIVIDRAKGSRHPSFPHIVYPLDYGYLKGASSMDGSGVDLWRGSLPLATADALIVTVDIMKRDSEIKLLIGLTDEEKKMALDFHNDSNYMKGIIIFRDKY